MCRTWRIFPLELFSFLHSRHFHFLGVVREDLNSLLTALFSFPENRSTEFCSKTALLAIGHVIAALQVSSSYAWHTRDFRLVVWKYVHRNTMSWLAGPRRGNKQQSRWYGVVDYMNESGGRTYVWWFQCNWDCRSAKTIAAPFHDTWRGIGRLPCPKIGSTVGHASSCFLECRRCSSVRQRPPHNPLWKE